MKVRLSAKTAVTLLLVATLIMTFILSPVLANSDFVDGSENYLSTQNTGKDVSSGPTKLGTLTGGEVEPNSTVGDESNLYSINGWSKIIGDDGYSAQLVIGINNGISDAYTRLMDIIAKHDGEVVNTVSMAGEIIAVILNVSLMEMSPFVEETRADGLPRYIEPRMKVQAQLVPNDPYWSLQWGPQKIEADWAWNTTIGDPSVLVAVIDTGVDYDHPDLAANYVALGYDWVNDDTDPMDDHGHGTHCAGIIAAVLNNSIGIAGLAQVSIMAEKGLDQYGWGYEDDLANAIIHAVDQGADILSNSWGGYGESVLIHDAVRYAYDAGVLVIAAAGNEAWDIKLYPAGYDEVVAVTATDEYDNPAWFTNFGDWVELAAPGVDIYSTVWDDSYAYKSGTSMATPHVSGVAALIWSRFPNMTRDWVRAQLRFTADDLGDPGFDYYYGYGRINARNAVEQAPPDHDLLIFDWEKPRYIEPGDLVSFNVTVLNYGINDENNITVQLLVDGNLTDSASIGSLASGTSTTVTVSWNPTVEGIYNVTFYVVPVTGETAVENNVATEMIEVRYPVGYVLFDQTHWTDIISYYSIWVANLTDRGYIVDTLTTSPITPPMLEDYDVFVIPQAHNYYSLDELSAIQDFVFNGGGLLVIGDDAPYIYTDLTSFAGIDWTYGGVSGITYDITSHEVTEGVTSVYLSFPIAEILVAAPALDLVRDPAGGIMLAVSEQVGRVIGFADEGSLWDYGIGNKDNLRLANNMIDWLLGVKYEHELVVRLDAPNFLEPGDSTLLNATVYNRGLNNETNVELFLLINGTVANNVTIPNLVNGTSYTIDYLWTPTVLAIYNVTVYAPPVPGENVTLNNLRTKYVSVQYPLIRPVEGQFANYMLYYYEAGWLIGTAYWNFTFDHYVEPYLIYITVWFKDPSGYVGTGWMIVNIMNRRVESGLWAGFWYPGWIETNITIGSTINLLDGTATVNGSRIIPVNMYPVDCWELSFWMYGVFQYTFWYDKVSGLWISMEFTDPYYDQRSVLLLVDTNVPIGTTYEHELVATLEAPSFLEPDDSSLLNATVYNIGLNTENNVTLSLIINGTEVESAIIPTLLNGTSYTISYLWTPTVEATYNVTAYATPVPGENFTANNRYTKFVRVTYAVMIGMIETHGESLHTEKLANYYTSLGHIVEKITTTITPGLLDNYDIIIVGEDWGDTPWLPSEIAAVEAFIGSGKGFVAIGDELAPSVQEILGTYGISYTGISAPGGSSSYFDPLHPIMQGVSLIYAGHPVNSLQITSPAYWIANDISDTYILIAGAENGGYVLCLSNDFAAYLHYDDNEVMFKNIVDWMTRARYTLTVYSVPSGVTFTVDGVSHTTPWSETYDEGASVSLVMPKSHDGFVWSYWQEDGDTNRIKTVTMDTNITLTGVFGSVPVGGKATSINTPTNKPELQIPWIWLSTIILPMVATVIFIKLKKKKQ